MTDGDQQASIFNNKHHESTLLRCTRCLYGMQADYIFEESRALYAALPREAIQDRSSASAGDIKMVGYRAPQGNCSSDPVKGVAGPYA